MKGYWKLIKNECPWQHCKANISRGTDHKKYKAMSETATSATATARSARLPVLKIRQKRVI